jgi:hypothetical protein
MGPVKHGKPMSASPGKGFGLFFAKGKYCEGAGRFFGGRTVERESIHCD